MRPDDVAAAEEASAVAFLDLDRRTHRPGERQPKRRPPDRAAAWVERVRHFLDNDAPGCWVAVDAEGRVVGLTVSGLRDGLWGLSTYAVLPGLQARGIGKRLLDAALGHTAPGGRGILCASPDPRAARRYRLAGFALHPAMTLTGRVDRRRLPALPQVREGSADDLELLEAVDRQARGASHGVDFPLMLHQRVLKVVDRPGSRGYAIHLPSGGAHVYALAAGDVETAQALLWSCLAEWSGDRPVEIEYLTAEQQWALDVGLAAGLEVGLRGYVGLRRMPAPTPYVPSAQFL